LRDAARSGWAVGEALWGR